MLVSFVTGVQRSFVRLSGWKASRQAGKEGIRVYPLSTMVFWTDGGGGRAVIVLAPYVCDIPSIF